MSYLRFLWFYLLMLITVVLICFVAFLVSLTVAAKFSAHGRRNTPPGPPGWPVLGNLPSLTKDIHLQLTKWRYQYGDVFSVRFGLQDAVIVNGSEAIKEALVQKANHFSNRPDYYLVRCVNMHFGAVFCLYGDRWSALRRFTVSTLRFFGMGTTILEEKIQEECRHFCSALRLLVGQPVDLKNRLETSVSNIIVYMAVGKRFEYGDPKFGRLQILAERINVTFYKLYIVNCFPMLRFFPGFRKMYNELMDRTAELYSYIREYIGQHGNTAPDDIRDFIDAFNKTKQDNPGFLPDMTLTYLIADLFSAGTETSSLTLCWGFLYLTAYPDVQEKVQAELDRVVGRDRPPAFSDRINLPYTEATIMEIQRIATIIPLLPHRTSDDTTLLGYDIPAGTNVIVNLWDLHMDPSRWPDPHRFDPARFLGENGRLLTHDAFMPFSTGYRRCWGEQMGKMELFLFLTNTLQQFTLKLPEGTEPDFHGISTAFIYPRPFSLIVTKRE
uniref:Uncharacterized protein n=1 Tax=Branchiostoma floridae TaxID=7739 RepID=C3YVT1_BRAFL|eukprot:XP_002599603.1 hypothetical protein BRAFLDRAFT_58542 [Branchiostoma floridae]